MKRPLGVTVIGVLMLLQGLPVGFVVAISVATQLNVLPTIIPPDVARQLEVTVPNGLLATVIWGGLGLLLLLGGVGMLLVRPWAWLLAMVLQGVTLANLLFGYSVGRQNYASMVFGVVVVFYLNSRSVRLAFDSARRRTRSASGPEAPGSMAPVSKMPGSEQMLRSPTRRHRQHPPMKDAST